MKGPDSDQVTLEDKLLCSCFLIRFSTKGGLLASLHFAQSPQHNFAGQGGGKIFDKAKGKAGQPVIAPDAQTVYGSDFLIEHLFYSF